MMETKRRTKKGIPNRRLAPGCCCYNSNRLVVLLLAVTLFDNIQQEVSAFQAVQPRIQKASLLSRCSAMQSSKFLCMQVKRPRKAYTGSDGRLRHRDHSTISVCKTATAIFASPPFALSTVLAPISGGSLYMLLLALQFAVQPILTKTFAPTTILRGTYLLAQDLLRIVTCLSLLSLSGSWEAAVKNWSFSAAFAAAGLPSCLYALQNYCSLAAYQNLPPITYNVLNQTKTLSAAICCYFLLGQVQSGMQILALGILLTAALVMESIIVLPFTKEFEERRERAMQRKSNPSGVKSGKTGKSRQYWIQGILPIAAASLISGLAGALTQRSLQQQHRNSLLFSMELAAVSSLAVTSSLIVQQLRRRKESANSSMTMTSSSSTTNSGISLATFTRGWTWKTWIPLATNATGGILVGLVTKYSGAVRKGFALILGMFLSALLQDYFNNKTTTTQQQDNDTKEHLEKHGGRVTAQQWVGGILAALSLWMHSSFPAR